MTDRLIRFLFRLRDRLLSSWPATVLQRNFPGSWRFIMDRFSILHFQGLPLSAIAITFFLNLLLLFQLTEKLMNSQSLTRIDSMVARFFYSIRTDFLAKSIFLFTQIGNEITIAWLTIVLIIIFIYYKLYSYLIPLLFTVLGSAATIVLGKNIYKVNRPDEFAYYAEGSFSFPSGHSTIAVAFYGYLTYLYIRSERSTNMRSYVFLAGIFLIFGIGFSRIYLCVHYLSDVAGGYLLGLSWLILAITYVEWNARRKKESIN